VGLRPGRRDRRGRVDRRAGPGRAAPALHPAGPGRRPPEAGEHPIADAFEHATILFADLVGFTSLSQTIPPAELVALLDDIFSRFDALVEERGLEKIKTIGDAYMVAGGVPARRADHVFAVSALALDMQAVLSRGVAAPGGGLHMRIGIHTGPVVAGVIGRRKFAYDLWGDAVNTAARMESHGVPGAIQISRAVRDALGSRAQVEPRGVVDVKGKGPMETFLLLGLLPPDTVEVATGP
jgi:adenylate cyclase